jgi:transposase
MKTRTAYTSDLSDKEWAILEPLLPKGKPGGRPRGVETREIVNGILYVLRSGCAWRLLPHDLPKWQTVYWYFRRWQGEGVWENINTQLREHWRSSQGREVKTSVGIIDSQSVRTSPKGGALVLKRPGL